MIKQMIDVPNTMVAFEATNDITKENFDNVVVPAVAELMQRTDKLNYLLVLDTPLRNFTIGAWISDLELGISNLAKWNRVGIVTDVESIKKFTDLFSKVVPGEFKGFSHKELKEAIDWVGEQNGFGKSQTFQEEGDSKD